MVGTTDIVIPCTGSVFRNSLEKADTPVGDIGCPSSGELQHLQERLMDVPGGGQHVGVVFQVFHQVWVFVSEPWRKPGKI